MVVIDLPLGETLQHLLERDTRLEPGQVRAEAEVEAVAEAQVALDLAMDVEAVRVRELTLVPVG